MAEGSPTAEELLEGVVKDRVLKDGHVHGVKLGDIPTGKVILALGPDAQAGVVAAAIRGVREFSQQGKWDYFKQSNERRYEYHVLVLKGLLRRKPPLLESTVIDLLMWVGETLTQPWTIGDYPLGDIAAAVEQLAGPEKSVSRGLEAAIRKAAAALRNLPTSPEARKAAVRLAGVLIEAPRARIEPGEAWADAARADLAAMSGSRLDAWHALLVHCQTASGTTPSAKWLKEAGALVEKVGRDDLRSALLRWFPLVDRPADRPPTTLNEDGDEEVEPDFDSPYPYGLHPDMLIPMHVDLLKGLAWCASIQEDRELARALASLALSAFRKISGVGPRLITLGHGAVGALGMMPGRDAVGQLARLKVKLKFIPAQKGVEKALAAAAKREGLAPEEMDELAVPAYGMEEVGRRREEFGEYVGELIVEGPDVELRWSRLADGKPLKSVPAGAKASHPAEVKELQATVKDVSAMLAAQRERIDNLFLARKAWPLAAWRERYLDHPLVGSIARRLIWTFADGDSRRDGIWLDGAIVDVEDRPIGGLGESTEVTLWHPIGRPVAEVTAWRDWTHRHEVRQPFKQAYREMYMLTDAERNTRVYSNRFAAHVLKQHQFHALCAARGWRNRLRLMVDDRFPPASKELPGWGLRAEFWVEGAGDEYGRDTTESGAYLYVSTDQVRFYESGAPQRQAHAGGGYGPAWGRGDAEPVPLERVPPLVLSEVLRDVDLFVGVASLGNDPNWTDGGEGPRPYQAYWHTYGFGDLSANGQTRKAALERIIPRLKIAARCSFVDRFLVVKGDLRTYKIHLGSGNILMEPNDQYLCIVPKQAVGPAVGPVFLPFEGDSTLSIILSKALMLAEDAKIKDTSITRQIQ